jgi:hypothetical protein
MTELPELTGMIRECRWGFMKTARIVGGLIVISILAGLFGAYSI